jgi:parallel beta-helix repeat protein
MMFVRILCLLITMLSYAWVSNAAIITPPKNVDLTKAVANLRSGDTLSLKEGAYSISEPIIMPSDTKIIGSGKDTCVIKLTSSGKDIITGSSIQNLEIRNLSLVGMKSGVGQEGFGIHLENIENVTMDGIRITNTVKRAVFIKGGSNVYITNIEIADIGVTHAPRIQAHGIVLSKINKGRISSANIRNTGQAAIFVYECSNIDIERVNARNCRGGIGAYLSENINVKYCLVDGCTGDHGMGPDMNCKYTYWTDNKIVNGQRFGFFIDRNSTYTYVLRNVIENNARGGILIAGKCDNNEIRDNKIINNGSEKNGYGIFLKGNYNKIIGNSFSGNRGGNIHVRPKTVGNVVR